METSEKITQLENEIKVLKNEVQAILLDIRDSFLSAENPFSAPKAIVTHQQTIIDRQTQTGEPKAENEPKAIPMAAPAEEEKPASDMIAAIEPKTNGNNNSNGNGNSKDVEVTISQEDFRGVEQGEIMSSQTQTGEYQTNRPQLDLVAYAALASWVEESNKRFGKERTETVLEISEAAGYLPSSIKRILTRLINIKPEDGITKPTSRDYLDSLVKLTALLGNKNDKHSALLMFLSQGDGRG
ncbi:MAG: hypothetical protein JW967_11635 [Dehalococcoidales bacterium]|nr:hypothetical protein [Dehalococcoidales bacterium]